MSDTDWPSSGEAGQPENSIKQAIQDLVNDIKSLFTKTVEGFDFRRAVTNLLYVASALSFLVGAAIIYLGISNGDSFINYDIGVYYIYMSILFVVGGYTIRAQFQGVS